MGVAFAEVSPDICFCVNTRRHRGVVSVAAGGVRHCNAGGRNHFMDDYLSFS